MVLSHGDVERLAQLLAEGGRDEQAALGVDIVAELTGHGAASSRVKSGDGWKTVG